jgi:osmoprotectant transport system permease protein
VNHFRELIDYLGVGNHWTGSEGLLHRIAQHLAFSASALVIALLVALPLGLWLGHRRRGGGAIVVNLSNTGRAVPTLAVLVLMFVGLGDHRTSETVAALALFALAPLVTNTYVGIRDVDPDVVEAARGMGLSGRQVLVQVELPLALPLLMAGIRIAVVQVVATATIAAYIGAGGLGRPVIDGLTQHDYGQVLAGALLVGVLALLLDSSLGLAQRWADPLRRLREPGSRRPAHIDAAEAERVGAVPKT